MSILVFKEYWEVAANCSERVLEEESGVQAPVLKLLTEQLSVSQVLL